VQEASAGNAAAAAALYGQLAELSTGTDRSAYYLEGASLWLQSGDLAAARRYLAQAQGGASPGQAQRALALTAEVEVRAGDGAAALATLGRLSQPLELPLLRDVAATRARALFQLGRPQEAIRELIEREVWLETAEEIVANQRIIWEGLAASPPTSVPPPTGDPVVDGWLALAPIAQAGVTDPATLRADLLQWREVYRDHPAAGALLADMLAESRTDQSFPQRIALLLPLGSLQQAAMAVRDGFFAAHLLDPEHRSVRISVYDTTAFGSQEAYLQAQLDGADFIVGPLLRPDVEEVAAQVGFVPTLALNFAQTPSLSAQRFFQFALAPEDEAAQVARHAVANGASTALALVPNNDWGMRLLESFRAEFESLGGRLLQFSGYDPNSQDFTVPITTLLNLSGSEQRYRRLAANLGTPLRFEPRRRQDVDMLFVAADARTGRLLAPQLRFHYAGGIPTYATAEIHEPNVSGDGDLNGVYFADTPWVLTPDSSSLQLKRQLSAYWPNRAPRWVRLYGMGFDAYRLIPMLYGGEGFTSLAAMSGELTLDADGRIRRRLPLAQFRGGRPVPLDTEGAAPDQALSQRSDIARVE
jgi:outer membrane PBP1 activator LpoA protein